MTYSEEQYQDILVVCRSYKNDYDRAFERLKSQQREIDALKAENERLAKVASAKILKDLKKSLFELYESVTKALYDPDTKETDKEYLRGCQDCIVTITWKFIKVNIMKTKQQILEAIKQCQKMILKPERECCSKCPYKREERCYGALLTDLLFYVEHDAISLVEWLKKHTDGEILNFEGDEVLFKYVDASKLDEKLDKFIEVHTSGG